MADNADQQEFITRLGELKDAIGEQPWPATRAWRVWAGEGRGCGQFSAGAVEDTFFSWRRPERARFDIDFADPLQLAPQLASWSVVANILDYFGELLPVAENRSTCFVRK